MKLGDRNMPGPGDPETWGPCTGDPMDPRSPPPKEFDDMTPQEQLEYLCDTYDAWTLAEMYVGELAEANLLRARLRKLDAERKAAEAAEAELRG